MVYPLDLGSGQVRCSSVIVDRNLVEGVGVAARGGTLAVVGNGSQPFPNGWIRTFTATGGRGPLNTELGFKTSLVAMTASPGGRPAVAVAGALEPSSFAVTGFDLETQQQEPVAASVCPDVVPESAAVDELGKPFFSGIFSGGCNLGGQALSGSGGFVWSPGGVAFPMPAIIRTRLASVSGALYRGYNTATTNVVIERQALLDGGALGAPAPFATASVGQNEGLLLADLVSDPDSGALFVLLNASGPVTLNGVARSATDGDPIVVRLDQTGAVVWTRPIDSVAALDGDGLALRKDQLLVAGHCRGPDQGLCKSSNPAWVVSLAP